jgi:hypothetical protein
MAGVLGVQKFILNQFNTGPSIGMLIGPVVGTIIGAAVGSFIQYRRNDEAIFDELNESIVETSMVHGFVAYTLLIGFQAFTRPVLSSAEEIILVTAVVVASLVSQALMFSEGLGEMFS